MSNYPPPGMQTAYPQPGYPPPPPQPSGCGGCLGKIFILLGVLFFLLIVACCGGGFYLRSYFKNSITQQATEIQSIRDDITSIDIPDPPLSPAFGGRFKMPVSGTFLGQGAGYTAPNNKALLVVASFSDAFGPQFKDQLVKALENGPGGNAGGNDQSHEELKDVKKSEVERTIRGEKAVFSVFEGVGVKSGAKKIQVQGEFAGKIGASFLFISAEEDTLSRKKVDRIINSIDGGQAEKK